MQSTQYWIKKLNLEPHPEGGHYKEVYRSEEEIDASLFSDSRKGRRSVSTAIYYLLEKNDFSAFHRIKSDELWHFYAGESVIIYVIDGKGNLETYFLNRENPLQIVPKNQWFAAEVEDESTYALLGCTVAPGFDFADFELGKREFLLSEYPNYLDLIERMTR